MAETNRQIRKYLTGMLAILGLSLLFSPPTLSTESATGAASIAGIPPIRSADELTIKLSQTVGDADPQIGVFAKNLRTGETFNLGGDREFSAASTAKLPIIGYLYQQVSQQALDLDQEVTIAAADLQRYGTGPVQYRGGGQRYSYRELTELITKQSDNTVSYVLTEKFDEAVLQDFTDSLGLADTDLKENRTTPRDMVTFLEKLYRGEIADPTLTRELLGLMRDTQFEQRLPAALPPETVVSHKTGDAFDGGKHDVGLIEYRGQSYAVAVFSRGLGDAKVGELSRQLFAYFVR